MFSDELLKYDWDETTARIMSMTSSDVERALSAEHLTDRDFMALVSLTATPYLEIMARKSRMITEQRFGKTMQALHPYVYHQLMH